MRIRKKIGLYYNRFRYYDPSLGQYTQQDPIGLAGGNPTLYGYVFNTMWELDPFGLDWKDLLETGLGHHLFPRSVAKKLGIEEWAKLTAYSWYPYETAGSGALHQKLHRLLIEQGVPFHGSKFMGTLEDFWELGDKAYESIDVKRYLKVPFSKNSKIYNDLTPQEALRKIRELQEAQKASVKVNYYTRRSAMDRILSTYSYGICLFSMEVLQDFLKKEKIRSKKLLHKFQKDKKLYLAMQKEGIWFPISKINSGQHLIKLEGYDNTFNDEWEQKFEIEGFNLKIEGGLWISDIGSFYTFNEGEFCGEAISFKTGDGDIQYSDFKYDVPAGKYLLSVKGFLRKEKKGFPNPNSGFLFSLVKVDEFSGFKNPREDIYNFNVTNM